MRRGANRARRKGHARSPYEYKKYRYIFHRDSTRYLRRTTYPIISALQYDVPPTMMRVV